jgi:hypothetical protein
MSWNGTNPQGPNWQGTDSTTGGGIVGDLYILPDPPTTAENPSIGLEGRNEVPLPLAYKDLAVDNLTATNINGNPNYDASNWWRYPANGNVTATLNPLFEAPQWDISGFEQISCVTLNTTQNVECGNTINAVLGNIGGLNCPDILMSPGDKVARLDCYGTNLVAGNNALYVEGGTTLTGGGVIHGVTIGALQVAGIDTVRIDVLPAGIDITSATFVSINAAGAANLVAGGALALAGGDYISYNSDQHRFINSSLGNDYTDLLVGNIYPALDGSASLRINGGGSGRGVELADVKSVNLFVETFPAWSATTTYAIDDKVLLSGVGYKALFANRNTAPNAPIPNWVSASNYEENDLVFSGGIVYQCFVAISGSTTPPTPVGDPNWNDTGFTANTITQIWTTEVPFVSTITGDNFSTITIGAIVAPVDFVRVDGDGFVAGGTTTGLDGFNFIDLVAQTGSDATISFNDSANTFYSRIFIDNTAKRLTIQSDTGLTINSTGATTTDFSAGVVENLKTLTLTSTIFSPWNVATDYADNAEVEYDNANWVSQFNTNRGNIPSATLQNWVSGDAYAIGNVRYYATNNKAYLCNTAITIGTTTPPPSDANWTEFQTGSNGEDVWFATTAPVVSTISGDRLSGMEIGTISCIGDSGSYLEITADPNDNANALVQSAGALGLIGTTAVSVVATTGTATIASFGDVNITGDTGVAIGSDNGNIALNAPVGTITLTSDLTTTISSTLGDINLTTGAGSKVIVNSTLDLNNNDVIDAKSITGAGALTLATTGATDLSLSPDTGGRIVANKELNLSSNNIINANTITGAGALTLATTGATNLNLSPDTGGLIVANKGLNLSNNNITNANTITGQGALTLVSTGANNINLSPSTGNRVNVTTDAQFNNRTLYNFTGTNVGGIYGLTTQPLALVGQQTTPQINLRGATTMWATASVQAPGNSISGVTTLNGRNIFSYGNFYNTASQTLGAINTATRVVMNTSANNNLITLDTTTNIGRITFTNAGVYKVVWNAYLLHGTGGPAKSCIWIRLNGTDVAGSGKTENNDSQLNETNLASSSLINATAGQYIEFFWASDSTTVPLTAVSASAPFPATPSFNCTITIVG